MIKFENVGKSFNDKVVLDSINLQLKERETHVLLGSSGCGKSTLLRLIMGIIEPTRGRVVVNGDVVSKSNVRQVRDKIGYVLQHGGLFPHLTNKENVFLRARLAGEDMPPLERRLNELCDLVSLDIKMMERYPREISGGQQQRVSLIRALIFDPPIMLLDEPLSALDPIIKKRLREDLMKIFAKLDKTVVFVTHDLNEAAQLGHTVTLLRKGKVCQHGTINELIQMPADKFVTKFIMAQRPVENLRSHF